MDKSEKIGRAILSIEKARCDLLLLVKGKGAEKITEAAEYLENAIVKLQHWDY